MASSENLKVWWVLGYDSRPEKGLEDVVKTFSVEKDAISFAEDIRENGFFDEDAYNFYLSTLKNRSGGEEANRIPSKRIYTTFYELVELINVSNLLGI